MVKLPQEAVLIQLDDVDYEAYGWPFLVHTMNCDSLNVQPMRPFLARCIQITLDCIGMSIDTSWGVRRVCSLGRPYNRMADTTYMRKQH